MQFEWNPEKAEANRRKHGVSFEEATEIFTSGAPVLDIPEQRHGENRWRTIGPISRGIIAVIWTERGVNDECVRVISARPASKRESAAYREHLEDIHG